MANNRCFVHYMIGHSKVKYEGSAERAGGGGGLGDRARDRGFISMNQRLGMKLWCLLQKR